MSRQLGLAISEILNRYFGEIVQKVGYDLFIYGNKPVAMIVRSTKLPRVQVIESLRTLLKYDLVSFEPSHNESVADYRLIPDNVLLLIRYPRYLLQMKTKYGSAAELLVEELLQEACCTASMLLITVANKYKDDKEKNITIVKLEDIFISIVTAGYIQQAPVAELKEGSEIPILVPVATIVPKLDARKLSQAMASGNLDDLNDNVYWRVNFDRFHQDFRDEVMIKAINRRIDDNAGELMRLLMQQMYLTSSPWAPESNPIPVVDLRDCCRRLATDRQQLNLQIDQYLKVLEENGAGFVKRISDSSGGLYVVQAKYAFEQLVETILDHVVVERLGSKAARIFRLIRTKKYIEEDDIQKYAMLPNKECKELTYKLMMGHFISSQPMRKAASAGTLSKAIYLYHINQQATAHSAQEQCYRALHNCARRGAGERAAHARLLDKRRRVRSIVHGMRLRQEPQQNIDDVEETITPPEHMVLQSVDKRLKQLSIAELELDWTLFILKCYFTYRS